MKRCKLAIIAGVLALLSTGSPKLFGDTPGKEYRQWNMYGGGPENIHYSSLDQINRENVRDLSVAWTYDTGDAFPDSEMQCNPIISDGILFATTPRLRVIALDAATGQLKWSFDPNEGEQHPGKIRNRGLTYWQNGRDKRIYFAFRHLLYALDAETGRPVPGFGRTGHVDLREGLGRDPSRIYITASTPGVVYKDTLIIGSLVSESLPSAPGHIRAYDLRTGRLRWVFRTIPEPGEFGYNTWPRDAWKYIGGANNWSGMTVDQKRGLVFVPTGSAAFDFYGANRHGNNLFANSLICLNAATGKRMWHFQFVRHDVWDRDLPTAPCLVTVRRGRRVIEAVAQITKSGHVFVFERATGKPVFPIEYRKVSVAGVDGEKLATTQPFPVLPPPFARQALTEDMLTRRTPEAHRAVEERFRKLRSRGQFEPPSLEGTIIFPGFDGGGEWGGAAFDPTTGLLYVNSNEMAWILRLVQRPAEKKTVGGRGLYQANCAGCHRSDFEGSPPNFPSLVNIGEKYNASQIRSVIHDGAGRMPGFSSLGDEAISAIAEYITTGRDTAPVADRAEPQGIYQKYMHDGYNKFLDPDGFPAVKPPWGTLSAIDLSRGKIIWQKPLGEYPKLAEAGVRDTGSENYGGAVVTSGGLIFIAATSYDKKFRAFDKASGELLWEAVLPTSGNATPATYEVDGRQYIVIGAGGGKGAPSGGTYVAFALPKDRDGK